MDDSIDAFLAVFIGIIIVLALIGAFVQPYFESRAFNECTGGHATYFTAAFTELRVQDCTH